MSISDQPWGKPAQPKSGPITYLDFREIDTASAHQKLGQDARAQIHKILAKRLYDLGGEQQVASQIKRARIYQAALNSKLQISGLDETIKSAIRQYQACLSTWAEGAGLADFSHPALPEIVDGIPIHPDDLAMLLQEDEVGCQTGVLREDDGAVILWHSEEDQEQSPRQRFDKLRLFFFSAAGGRTIGAFIYPDLLPGPTFGWQAGEFIQAIDTLHVRQVEFNNAILPNTLAWLSLYLGAQVSRQALVENLGPFQGGYSVTAAYQQNGRVAVEKVEFANNQSFVSTLGGTPGSYMFQTNIICDLSQSVGAEEKTSPESRAWNEKRLARTARFMRVIQGSSAGLAAVFRLLRSRLGGESSYANNDVKAQLVCRMEPGKTTIWVGPGAANSGGWVLPLEI